MGLLGSIGSLAGGYFGGSTGAALGGILGGALEGGAQTAGGMMTSEAAKQNALQAAQLSQFRPVGITNTFGTSNFGYDPTSGQMTSAGYTLSPALQSYQNALMGQGAVQQNLADLASQQALGRSYLATTPQELASNWLASQRELLAPSRDQSWSRLNNQLFNTGRTGLSVAQGGNLQAANPEAAALANAQAMQDLQLAAQAQTQGQNQYLFGQGLLSSAYQPLTTGLSAAGAVEGLGQQPLELSASLAGRNASAGANAGKYLTSAAAGYSPSGTLLSSLGGSLSNFTGNVPNLFGLGNWTGTPSGLDTSNIDYSYLSKIYSGGNPYAGTSWDGE